MIFFPLMFVCINAQGHRNYFGLRWDKIVAFGFLLCGVTSFEYRPKVLYMFEMLISLAESKRGDPNLLPN